MTTRTVGALVLAGVLWGTPTLARRAQGPSPFGAQIAALSELIRSVFGRYAAPSRPGDASDSRLHAVDDLLREHAAGRLRHYGDIASR